MKIEFTIPVFNGNPVSTSNRINAHNISRLLVIFRQDRYISSPESCSLILFLTGKTSLCVFRMNKLPKYRAALITHGRSFAEYLTVYSPIMGKD